MNPRPSHFLAPFAWLLLFLACLQAPLHSDFETNGEDIESNSGGVKFDSDDDGSEDIIMLNGNLGISTLSPGYKLDVDGDANISGNLVFGGNIQLSNNQLLLADGTNSLPSLSFLSDQDMGLYYNSAGKFSFVNGGVESLTIDANGNLGIGTETPDAILKLEDSVGGNFIRVTVPSRSANKDALQLEADNTNATMTIRSRVGTSTLTVLDSLGMSMASAVESGQPGIKTEGAATDIVVNATRFRPISGTVDLGSSSRPWSDLYLATGTRVITQSQSTATTLTLNLGDTRDDGLASQHAFTIAAPTDYSKTSYLRVMGTTDQVFIIGGNGNVGIGTTVMEQKLVVAGNITPSANTTFDLGSSANIWKNVYTDDLVISSDRRKKRNIEDLDHGLDKVLQLRPVTFNWKQEGRRPEIGFIAQEVQEVIDEAVHVGKDKDHYLGISYNKIIPFLVKAIQEQDAELREQRKLIQSLLRDKRKP